jgi:hypothetical protein
VPAAAVPSAVPAAGPAVSPVPEPGTPALVGAVLASLAFYRRMRRR